MHLRRINPVPSDAHGVPGRLSSSPVAVQLLDLEGSLVDGEKGPKLFSPKQERFAPGHLLIHSASDGEAHTTRVYHTEGWHAMDNSKQTR